MIVKQLYYIWRWSCTCLAFVAFSIGGLLCYLTIFKVIRFRSATKLESETKVRKFISQLFNLLLRFLEITYLIKIESNNLEELQQLRGALVISNHPCLLDVLVIMAKIPNCQCVVKNKLWNSLFLGGVMRSAGFVCNNIDPEEFMNKCKDELATGQNIIIFPEGTRTTAGQELKMQRGIGNLAIATNADIQALTISCNPLWLTKQDRWYRIPENKITLKISNGRKFSNQNYSLIALRSLRVRALMRDIQEYYNGYIANECFRK